MTSNFDVPVTITDGSHTIVCPFCPAVYPVEEIAARNISDGEIRPLAVRGLRPTASSRFFGRYRGRQRLYEQLSQLSLLGSWEFVCPNGHLVNVSFPEIPIAVGGRPGSSKTHFLTAVVREMDDLARLAAIGVRMKLSSYGRAAMRSLVEDVYDRGRTLPATPIAGDGLFFACRITLSPPTSVELRSVSFLIGDLAGEAFDSSRMIAHYGRYLLISAGLIYLVDPYGILPVNPVTKSDEPASVGRSPLSVAAEIRMNLRDLVESLEIAHNTPTGRLKFPLCMVVAKSDIIDWPFDFASETPRVLADLASLGTNMHSLLVESSERVRVAFIAAGGGLVVDEIESLVDPTSVRWAAASAVGVAPQAGAAIPLPEPIGAALAMMHMLDLLDQFAR